jgi:hypothetical protein
MKTLACSELADRPGISAPCANARDAGEVQADGLHVEARGERFQARLIQLDSGLEEILRRA